MKVAAIIPAAGRGERFKSKVPKSFVSVLGKPLLVHTLRRLQNCYAFEEMVVMVQRSHQSRTREMLKRHGFGHVRVEIGGSSRADSVKRGFLSLTQRSEWVLVHDAARPLVDTAFLLRTLSAAKKSGAALCGIPVTATVKRLRPGQDIVLSTQDRRYLYLAQTPQVFRKDLLLARYRALGKKALKATDEAALFDKTSVPVRCVEGDVKNIKVTTQDDLELVKYYLSKERALN